MRTRWRRLLDVDDAEHLCGVAELFNLDGAHINSSPSKVGPLCERLLTEPTNQRLLPLAPRWRVPTPTPRAKNDSMIGYRWNGPGIARKPWYAGLGCTINVVKLPKRQSV
jgi:hypothetical protein